MNGTKPLFPIQVHFQEDNETWILENETEVGNNLEWFDSEDPDENVLVTDSNGQILILQVEKLAIKRIEIK